MRCWPGRGQYISSCFQSSIYQSPTGLRVLHLYSYISGSLLLLSTFDCVGGSLFMKYSLCFPHVTIYSLRPGLCIIILPNTMPRRLRSKRMRKSMPATQRSNNTGRGVYVTHKIQDPCLSSQGTLHAPDFNQDLKRDLRSTVTSGKCPHSLMPCPHCPEAGQQGLPPAASLIGMVALCLFLVCLLI